MLPDMHQSLQLFFEKTFNKECGVPQVDAKKVSIAVAGKIKDSMGWEYSSE
jgi:hypothetical protein